MKNIRCIKCGKRATTKYGGTYYCRKCGKEAYDANRCFIATAAYGTPFSNELDVLRGWRDNGLKTNWLGKKFVNFYYATSPPIADFIRTKDWLRWIVRKCLNPFVNYLKKR